jgi:non-specific serine/threonine protein kinase
VQPTKRTLRGTLDWSHDLLSGPERILFRRLSVFTGGWTLEAAEAVCSGGDIEREYVLDLLGGLVDKSLVVAGPSTGSSVRYRMLEPIGQYAREKQEESGEGEKVRQQHTIFFLTLAEEAGPLLWGQEQATWLRRLEPDHDNLRAALSWALESGRTELGLQAAGKLWRFWWMRGYYDEGKRWLSEALNKDRQASKMRAEALMGMGWLALEQGDMERAKAAAEEGLKLTTKAVTEGSVDAFFRGVLGDVAKHRGKREEAARLYEESLALSREAGDKQGIAWALLDLANVSSDRGDYARAARLLEEGLTLGRELGSAQPLGYYLISLGYESLLQGDHMRATELNEQALALLRERGHSSGVQYALDNLGWAALVGGNHEQAETLHREGLALAKELGDRKVAAESLEGLACAAWAKGETERGTKLFGAAEGLREAIGYRRASRESTLRRPYLVAARFQQDEAVWKTVFAEGKAMELQEAVNYALSEEEPATIALPQAVDAPLAHAQLPALTRREEEIAVLVARGLTNRQIASELSISEHTAASHVRRILKKLGLKSRAQIGSWLTQQQP